MKLALWIVALALVFTTTAHAHPLAPVVLQLTETDHPAILTATLKEPAVRPRGAVYTPSWPAGCEPLGAPAPIAHDEARLTRYRLQCPDLGGAPLAGHTVGVKGLDGVTAIVRITHPDGREHQALLDAEHPTAVIPAAPSSLGLLADYLALGARHLLAGLDHLLFILGLMLLVRGRRRLVVALTTFTLGHSVTLGAAVLGVVQLPSAPIELGIALSLVLLALQIARAQADDRHAPRR
ncbi:MAG: HupE/UreJ family protein, partial [Polyangiaceae bacterium]